MQAVTDGGADMERDSSKSRELHARGLAAGDIAATDTRESTVHSGGRKPLALDLCCGHPGKERVA